MSSRRSNDLSVFGTALIVLTADQISKHLVRLHLDRGIPWDPISWLRPVLSLTYVTNEGAAFGLFPQLKPLYPWIAVAVIAIILFYFRRFPLDGWLIQVSLGMQLAGALGNLIDRLFHNGKVTDFIDLNFWPLQEWPVFNVADSSIVVGVCILAALLLLEEGIVQPSSEAQPGEQEHTP